MGSRGFRKRRALRLVPRSSAVPRSPAQGIRGAHAHDRRSPGACPAARSSAKRWRARWGFRREREREREQEPSSSPSPLAARLSQLTGESRRPGRGWGPGKRRARRGSSGRGNRGGGGTATPEVAKPGAALHFGRWEFRDPRLTERGPSETGSLWLPGGSGTHWGTVCSSLSPASPSVPPFAESPPTPTPTPPERLRSTQHAPSPGEPPHPGMP